MSVAGITPGLIPVTLLPPRPVRRVAGLSSPSLSTGTVCNGGPHGVPVTNQRLGPSTAGRFEGGSSPTGREEGGRTGQGSWCPKRDSGVRQPDSLSGLVDDHSWANQDLPWPRDDPSGPKCKVDGPGSRGAWTT